MIYLSHIFCGGQRISVSICSISLRKAWRGYSCGAYVTLNAAQFQHHWENEGPIAHLYHWQPSAQLSSPLRGAVVEKWVRRMLQETYPDCVVEDAMLGTRVDGHPRNWSQAEYDFLFDGRKVEIKSCQLCRLSSGSWWVQFNGIKFQHSSIPRDSVFHDLFLVIISPEWLHLVKHDLQTRKSKSGRSVMVLGKQGPWWKSEELILDQLCKDGDCEWIGKTHMSDSWIAEQCKLIESFAAGFYRGKPFASMSPQLRGFRIEGLVREFDQLLHPEMDFSRPGKVVDWMRGETRVEVKSAQLVFSSDQKWYCRFRGIKPERFDELLLVIYSPRGLDLFKFDMRTEIQKASLSVSATQGELHPLAALQQIEERLEANHCHKIASISWDA